MLHKRHAFVLITALLTASFAATPAYCVPSKATGKPGTAFTGKHRQGTARAAKETGKDGQRRIVTYSLFGNPLYKPNVVLGEPRALGAAPRIAGLGTGLGSSVAGNADAARARLALKPEDGTDNAGVVFGCREKALGAIPRMYEVTACYRHNVDKSWKAQTYVSRGFVEGSQHWGGGLSVAYAY